MEEEEEEESRNSLFFRFCQKKEHHRTFQNYQTTISMTTISMSTLVSPREQQHSVQTHTEERSSGTSD